METLSEKQQRFVFMVGDLIAYAKKLGYGLTWGQTLRSDDQAKANAAKGTGISNSLHTIGLAVDFNLFINGVYQTDSAAHLPLGEYWESIGGSWGGRFLDKNGKPKPDGNHYSLSHNGVK